MTGAGGEVSKARNAEVCLRAGWRMRRPAAGAPPASAARRLRRTRPNAERRRRTPEGREQVSGRSAGSTQATVVPKPMRIRGCAGLARYVSASPASGTDTRGLGTMLVRARQCAQPVHAVRRAPPPVSSPILLRVLRGETTCFYCVVGLQGTNLVQTALPFRLFPLCGRRACR